MPATWPFGSLMTVSTHSLSAALTVAWLHVPSLGTQHDGHLPPANQGLTVGVTGKETRQPELSSRAGMQGALLWTQDTAPLH